MKATERISSSCAGHQGGLRSVYTMKKCRQNTWCALHQKKKKKKLEGSDRGDHPMASLDERSFVSHQMQLEIVSIFIFLVQQELFLFLTLSAFNPSENQKKTQKNN